MTQSSQKFLSVLNPVQQKAVTSTEGPVLVLAGAGSGKTRVLTYRIAYLIQEKIAAPGEILAMTFTNKAAGEMKERVNQFVKFDSRLWIGTFHSLFARLLRTEAPHVGYTSDYTIYDTQDKIRLIKSLMEELGIGIQMFSPNSIAAAISRCKNDLVSPDEYSKFASGPYEEAVARLYPIYQQRMHSFQAFDFDDLLTVPVDLFQQHPDVLEKYQSRFKYILVDEYQDTNRAQYRMLHSLAQMHGNLFVVGDDDQSIYGWRGANLRNILDFEKDYPEAQVYRLEQNYRSTQNVLKAANSLVEKNVGRKGKTLWTDREEGSKVQIHIVEDEREEALKVVEKIKDEVFENKRTFRDFGILYRTNAQSRALEEGLLKHGLSYIIVGGIRFYERKEIKDVLAYLKLIANPKDNVNLKRIINFPMRGIGEKTLERMEAWALDNRTDLFQAAKRIHEIDGISDRIKKNVSDFHQMIQKYIDLKDKISPNELVHTLVDEAGLLLIYKEDTSSEGQDRADNIREFLAAVRDYVDSSESPALSGFLAEVSLVSDIDSWDDKANAVTLMTLHSAKGLEFPVVLITGLEDGLFPISRCLDDPEQLEEERRLFYVGLTRAKDSIYLSWAQKRMLFNDMGFRIPSRFLDEIDRSVIVTHEPKLAYKVEDFLSRSRPVRKTEFDPHPDYASFSQETNQLKVGLRIKHDVFGTGKISGIEGKGKQQKIQIMFDAGFQKKFLAQYAQLTIL